MKKPDIYLKIAFLLVLWALVASAVTKDCRKCMKGSLILSCSQNKNEVSQFPEKTETATFGAGCFWHVEDAFRHVEGVIDSTVGYTGGQTEYPTYKEVCTDRTGHAEVVQILYDPSLVSYSELLEVFWTIHDPTTLNRQGRDIGKQYRSAIFYHNENQRTLAEASRSELEISKQFDKPIVTEITSASTFYPAEEYHQQYFEKMGIKSCPR